MNNIVKNLSIKSKLLILVAVSLGLAIFFGVIHTWVTYQDKQEMTQISALVELSTDMSELMHESQLERSMSAGYLDSKGKLFATELPEQTHQFDSHVNKLQKHISVLDIDLPEHQRTQLNEIASHLKHLTEIRQKVLSQQAEKIVVLEFYTELNEMLLGYMEYLTHVSTNAEVSEKILAFTSFLEVKEEAGIERALLASVFLKDKFEGKEYREFVSLAAVQESHTHLFKATATEENVHFYKKVMSGASITQVEKLRNIAHEQAATGGFGIDTSLWFAAMSKKMDSLKQVENQLSVSLLDRVHELLDRNNFAFMLSFVMLLVGLFIVNLLAITIVRSISSAVTSLKETMLQIEQTGNLSLQVPVDGQDEFAEIATSYNRFTGSFKQVTDSTNQVLDKIANGDFSGRMNLPLNGDLATLQKGVNGSAESVEFMMTQLDIVMDALGRGDFKVRMDQKVPAAFRAKVDNSLEIISSSFSEVQSVMNAMQQGKYSERVNSEVPGELNDMKIAVNAALSKLDEGIDEINNVMLAQASGDLNLRVTGHYEGRLNELTQSINSSILQMSTAVASVKSTAFTVRGAAGEVAQSSDSLSNRAQMQAASLEETAASIEQITSTINQATELAEQASDLSNEAITSSRHGAEVMSETVDAMERINTVSVSINDIISLIDNIAFQTNLLALNAAVEAARAGEHGRGFAVVAGEVRNLAGRSAEAAKQIKTLIEKTNKEVAIGTELVKSSGEALTDINTQIERVSLMVSDIAKGSREQATGIDQINHAMATLDQTTQENAALVEETASASVNMSEDAEILEGIVNKFKVDDSALRLAHKA